MKYRILLFIVFAFCVGNIIADDKVWTITKEVSQSDIKDSVVFEVEAEEISRSSFPTLKDISNGTFSCISERSIDSKIAKFTIKGSKLGDSIPIHRSERGVQKELIFFIKLIERADNLAASDDSSPEDDIAPEAKESVFGETPIVSDEEAVTENQGEFQNYVLWGIIVVVVLLLLLLFLVYLNLILKKLLIEQKEIVELISKNLEKNSANNQERSNVNLVKQSGIDGKIDSLLEQFALLSGTIENLQQSVTRVSATATINRSIQGKNDIQTVPATSDNTFIESIKYCGYNAGIHGFKSKDFSDDSNRGQFIIYLGNGKYEYGINSILADQLWPVLALVENAVELSGDKYNVNGKTVRTVQRGVLVKDSNGDFTIREKAKVEIVTK